MERDCRWRFPVRICVFGRHFHKCEPNSIILWVVIETAVAGVASDKICNLNYCFCHIDRHDTPFSTSFAWTRKPLPRCNHAGIFFKIINFNFCTTRQLNYDLLFSLHPLQQYKEQFPQWLAAIVTISVP